MTERDTEGRFAGLEPEIVAAVLIDIRAGVMGRNAIGRKHNIGLGTVSKIAARNGLHDAFDRSRTARAVADRQIDLKARRIALAEDLLADAERLRDRLFDPYTAAMSGKEGVEHVTLDEPDAAAVRNIMTSIAVAVDKHIALDRHDADGGLGELGSMFDGLLRRFGLKADPDAEPAAPGAATPADEPDADAGPRVVAE